MPRSAATTVDEYLQSLPDTSRAEISRVRDVILASLPMGYEEGAVRLSSSHPAYPSSEDEIDLSKTPNLQLFPPKLGAAWSAGGTAGK